MTCIVTTKLSVSTNWIIIPR